MLAGVLESFHRGLEATGAFDIDGPVRIHGPPSPFDFLSAEGMKKFPAAHSN
jgi:hypothetical protein